MKKSIAIFLNLFLFPIAIYAQQPNIFGNPNITWPLQKSINILNKGQNTQLSNDSIQVQWNYIGKPWGASILNLQRMSNGVFYLRTEYDSWYISTDIGNTWQKLSTNIDISEFGKIYESSDGKLYIGSSEGLYRSEDGGNYWQQISNELVGDLIFSSNGYFISNLDSIVAVSQDGGITWQKYDMPGIRDEYWYCVPLAIDRADNLYCIDAKDRLFISKDFGQNWTFQDSLPVPSYFLPEYVNRIKKIYIVSDSLMILTNRGDYCFRYYSYSRKLQRIWIPGARSYYLGHSTDNVMWGSAENTYMELKFYLMKSTDYGETWQKMKIWDDNAFSGSCPVWFEEDAYICRCGRKGLRKSVDGGNTWIRCERGLDYNVIVSLAAINLEHIYIGTVKGFFYGGIYKYQGDSTWQNILENKETDRVWEINYRKLDDHIVIYSQSNDKIMRNIDFSSNWSHLSSLSWNPGENYPSPTYYSSYIDKKGNLYTGINDWGIYHMKYNGSRWILGNSGFPYDYVFFIDEDCLGNIVVKTWRSGEYYKSSNGTNWEKINIRLSKPNSFCAIDSSTIYGCTEYGLYKSNNNCHTLNRIRSGNFLKAIYIREINCLICAIYEEGLSITYDEGETWINVNANDYFKAIRDLEIDLDGNIYIATERGGVYFTDYFISEIDTVRIPSEMQINSLYPNPSNNYITVDFSIDKEQDLKIFVYDIKGRLLIQNTNYFLPGLYNQQINISQLPSGIYFLKILSREKQKVLKFTVIK
jgi:photosystem II stability/assembly factor-like uncharacterized protein